VHRELVRVLLDLRRELARRRHDERARDAALLVHEAIEDREQERRGLAAAGHGAGEHVAALDGGGDGVLLDRRRTAVPHLADAAQEIGMETKLGERQANAPRCKIRLIFVSERRMPAGLRYEGSAQSVIDAPERQTAGRLAGFGFWFLVTVSGFQGSQIY
jgi:hypothetical protein